MGLADAHAMHPSIDVFEADERADRRLLEALADWCDRYTPLVALDGADGLFLDITGCSHLFGGEEALLEEMVRRFREQGFDARIAIASTAGAAWAVARFHGSAVIPDGEETGWLASFPIAALRLEPEVCTALDSVGLRTIGAIMAAPRAPLVRRFGKALLLRLDQACGRLEEVLSPRLPVPDLSAERRLMEPITTIEDVERVILPLAQSLRGNLEQRDVGALALQLLLFRVDGAVTRLPLALSSPARAPERVARLFHERLGALEQKLDAGYGFDLVRLSVLSTGVLAPRQGDLAERPDDAGEDLSLFVDRVSARLGSGVVRRPAAMASHVPERAVTLLAWTRAPDAESDKAVPPPRSERPLRLLRQPERIDVMAEVPEGPPLNFRWRRAHYRIARAEGPERIAPEWWLESLPPVEKEDDEKDEDREKRYREAVAANTARSTRDYFRVEDAEGRRYWLYRQGLYGTSGERPCWFLHGMFA